MTNDTKIKVDAQVDGEIYAVRNNEDTPSKKIPPFHPPPPRPAGLLYFPLRLSTSIMYCP